MAKSIFKNVEDCTEQIDRYFKEFLKSTGEIADIESLGDYLGITREEIINLCNDKKYGKTFQGARNKIAKIKKQLAFNGKIPATVLSFDLKNNHGYKDKPEDSESAGIEQVIFKGKVSEWAE
ncbi:MAG: hypothetical protein IKT34_02555 [Clostridia bacterium]|nr:hypothetical protein [Clostridia bacterium]